MVESHGFLAPSAQAVLNDLAQYAQDVLGLRAVEMAGYLKRLVAIAIQRGNAALDRTPCSIRATHTVPRWRWVW